MLVKQIYQSLKWIIYNVYTISKLNISLTDYKCVPRVDFMARFQYKKDI